MQDLIGYDDIIENSMRLVIYETLKKIEKSGLIGKHHFVISFLTNHPQVHIPQSLKDKYHEEMTVALQHQFENLIVKKNVFEVSLSFAGNLEKLIIPYKAVTSFSDPSMNFMLKFSASFGDFEDLELESDFTQKTSYNKNKKPEIDLSAKVISLDAFRNNKPKN